MFVPDFLPTKEKKKKKEQIITYIFRKGQRGQPHSGIKPLQNIQRIQRWFRIWREKKTVVAEVPWVFSPQQRRVRGASWYPTAPHKEQRRSAELCTLVTAKGPKGTAWSCIRGELRGGIKKRFSTRGWWAWHRIPKTVVTALSRQISRSTLTMHSVVRFDFRADLCGARGWTRWSCGSPTNWNILQF